MCRTLWGRCYPTCTEGALTCQTSPRARTAAATRGLKCQPRSLKGTGPAKRGFSSRSDASSGMHFNAASKNRSSATINGSTASMNRGNASTNSSATSANGSTASINGSKPNGGTCRHTRTQCKSGKVDLGLDAVAFRKNRFDRDVDRRVPDAPNQRDPDPKQHQPRVGLQVRLRQREDVKRTDVWSRS